MGRRLQLGVTLLVPWVAAACTAGGDRPPSPSPASEFVRVPAGSFQMGCVPGDEACSPSEKPRHRVTISRDFWMMRIEVTVGAYKKFAAATGRKLPDGMQEPYFNRGWKKEFHPMVGIVWSDADAYCRSGGGRLPTEAQWEYAARGGQDGWKYVWGNEPLPLVNGRKQANVADESGKKSEGMLAQWTREPGWFDGYDDGYPDTSPVGAFAANALGLYDMAGNAWEYCSDWYGDEYYSVSPPADPTGPAEEGARVARGGSALFSPGSDSRKDSRVSQRAPRLPGIGVIDAGFRCVRDTPGP